MKANVWIFLGSVLGFLSVALGAFGAHVLAKSLSEKDLATFQTAVEVQMIHALALVGLGIWALASPGTPASWPGLAFTTGIVLFSGSLYLIAFTGIRAFGMITPIGGTAFLIGWVAMALLAWRAL